MKLISWNVNGLRAVIKKGFNEQLEKFDADFICLQETKCKPDQVDTSQFNYKYAFWNSADKAGYSGTLILTNNKPISVFNGLGIEEHDAEGRVITLEYDNYYLVTVYTPNSKQKLARLEYRMVWEDEFRKYLLNLKEKKNVIICGDLNVAHNEIDIAQPDTNHKNAGFSDEEREKMSVLLDSGFVDTFRYKYPTRKDVYTFWTYFRQARERNIGWRIDYFLVNEKLKTEIVDAVIYDDILGSDHCPIQLEINL
ncbi:exodeoxyribonuclease III [Mycoplasma sp. P36-A1]|uniref:exodeoxyribonuclease III n=1 Tax=Mycoplasma sp. P36-A1 TaxID=3252900 RepID=UPI003C2B6517